ncbi:MAG: mechanosensitive ion channel domain-containing protein [Candidatus Accumulibacter phosphatis]|nr:mechanosensitive ion channel domain-containing protein [Candidatus Accumulibacter sp. ACC012]
MPIRNASHRFLRRFVRCPVWVLLLVSALLIPAAAAEAPGLELLSKATAALDRIERQLDSAGRATKQELRTLEAQVATVRASALDCVQGATLEVKKLDRELAILGPNSRADGGAGKENPSSEQAEKPVSSANGGPLQDSQRRKADLEERIARCKLLLLRTDDLDSQVDHHQRRLQTRQLLVRGPGLVDLVQANLDGADRWLDFTTQLAARSTGWHALGPLHLAAAAALGLLGFFLGRSVQRRQLAQVAAMKVENGDVSAGLVQALVACAISYAPVLLALGGLSAYVAVIPRAGGDLPFVAKLVYGLLAYFLVVVGIRSLLSPCRPATYYLSLSESVARPLGRRSRMLLLLALTWWLVQELRAEGLLSEIMFSLTRKAFDLLWVLNVIWVIWLLRRLHDWRDKWSAPLLISLALFAGLLAGWIGYANLERLIINGVSVSLLLFGLALVASRFFADLFDGLDEGRYRWQKTLRQAIGLKGDEYVPGLYWLRLLLKLLLWIAIALLVLRVWGAGEINNDILRYFSEGFEVAGVNIVPGQLLWAILALVVLLTLTRWFKGRLESKWLLNTRMENSAREALVTTFGYLAVALSVIVALSIAGIQFTNLAIIAGAMSVGIGFGLQNVINNFVSGIIMLVERPVKSGDRIIVGGTEGYVERISIRTTTIRTLERADVIVPNSDLISGQVTNLTLRNTWGRITVPIGVAYGSNVERVIETLHEVANNHPEVIRGNPELSEPYALFLSFGDSALMFELRAFIREVDRRQRVISDINRAIDAAFREEGIEIPFPQRDINFRGPLRIERAPVLPRPATAREDPPEA